LRHELRSVQTQIRRGDQHQRGPFNDGGVIVVIGCLSDVQNYSNGIVLNAGPM
jgi:hypothetical protein